MSVDCLLLPNLPSYLPILCKQTQYCASRGCWRDTIGGRDFSSWFCVIVSCPKILGRSVVLGFSRVPSAWCPSSSQSWSWLSETWPSRPKHCGLQGSHRSASELAPGVLTSVVRLPALLGCLHPEGCFLLACGPALPGQSRKLLCLPLSCSLSSPVRCGYQL